MIRRTLFEWQSIAYGTTDDTIPEAVADRLVAVASLSPLGGKNGARILTHGRKELRAGQVVGMVATDGCALEILPKIDFLDDRQDSAVHAGLVRRQLVHMLAVAMELDIDSGADTELGWQQENLLEILISLFIKKLSKILHQGMPSHYIQMQDDLMALRGRLNTVRQFSVLLSQPQTLACEYDEFSKDIALNQVMKAAIERLLRISKSQKNITRLRELTLFYTDVRSVPIPLLRWQDIKLDRTNNRWRELVSLCRLLLGQRFQNTSSGDTKGYSLLFEMNTLFEAYIARQLRRAVLGTDLTIHSQGGRLHCLVNVETNKQSFMTKPDIIVKRANDVVLIIDTKWKRLNTAIDDPKQGVSQADIYQMMAYGRLYSCSELMLLYPHHIKLSRDEGVLSQHRIVQSTDVLKTATIDVAKKNKVVLNLKDLLSHVLLVMG